MTDTTPRLTLPYILPSQAQKHVTHNEALAILDAVTQLVIEDSLTTPPDAPSSGACYWVLTSATGAWSGHDASIATWQDDTWVFLTPQNGWLAFFRSDSRLRSYHDSLWTELLLPTTAQFNQLGINSSPDTTNKLAVASDAILFNHNGSDQRVKLNKAATGNTASLLYQSNWQGKAEIGLAGSDELSIKVCDDAGNWTTALTITGKGYVKQPAKPAATARFAPSSFNVSNGQVTGFDAVTMSQGGMVLNTAIGTNLGKSLKIPISGLYLVSLILSASATTDYVATLVNETTTNMLKIGIGTVSGVIQTSQTTLLNITEGTELSVLHTGTATLGATTTGVKLAVSLL
ncbi:hypothetical protein H4S14_000693 [Agrobacterium vitis]|nr:hypothetical protein [Agrobacterium vitis]MBE1436966.1 hypothetical protein [Agrobacterium vitis]